MPATAIADPLHQVATFEVAQGKYDWRRQAAEQWFLAAAQARGVEQFLAFVNSPPGRMTRNGITNLGPDKTSPTNLNPGYDGQCATYLADVLAHFRDDGVLGDTAHKITFGYVSRANEPDLGWTGRKQHTRHLGVAPALNLPHMVAAVLAT